MNTTSRFAHLMARHAADAAGSPDGAVATLDALLAWQRAERVGGHLLELGLSDLRRTALLALHAQPDEERCFLLGPQAERRALAQALRSEDLAANVKVLRAGSWEFARSALVREHQGEFRWVHVDEERSASAVLGAIRNADELLGRSGVLSIGSFMSSAYPQVTEAVFRSLREGGERFTLFLCGFGQAYLARPQAAHGYLGFCAGDLAEELERRGVSSTVFKTTHSAEMGGFGVGPRVEGRRTRGPDWAPDALYL